jgi:ABC-type transport system involved in multi-copper enzyme maturation permease subunit
MVNEAESLSHDSRGGLRGLLLGWLAWALGLSWLTGPIFDKELRVSSRRRRNYVLRFLYVALFMCLLALLWLNVVRGQASSVYQASRMAFVGQAIVSFVVWFQFMATQAIAIVMLSASISDEIYKRTLGVLMTTPISGVQIVLGKLLSKLLQVVLLLAITLPLLSVVRVFGGVPWDYLVCSLCVTLTTIVFLGSLSLFCSILSRRAYVVIIRTAVVAAMLFVILPFIVGILILQVVSQRVFFDALSYVNPYVVMEMAVEALVLARPMASVHWQAHCLVSLGASTLLLSLATVMVRRAALRQATGESGVGWTWRRGKTGTPRAFRRVRGIRRVAGHPVLWKERRTPLLGRWKLGVVVVTVITLILLGVTYVRCATENVLSDPEVHVGYAVVFLGVGLLVTAVLPATCVTSEKESGTWTLLLTTTLTDWEILWGKLLGAVRRCLPAWLLLFGHVALFTMAGIIHPIGILQLAILASWIILFLSGAGLYFSTLFRHTTTAVIANVALAAGLWAVAPVLMGLGLAITGANEDLLRLYLDANPVVQTVIIVAATARTRGLAAYNWIHGGLADPGKATGWILLNFILYTTLGLAFLALAKTRLRRNAL